jgi:hypothetical protein
MAVCLNESDVDEWLGGKGLWEDVVGKMALDDESAAYGGLECYESAGFVSKVGERGGRNVLSLREWQDGQDKIGIKSFFGGGGVKPEALVQKIPDRKPETDKSLQENPFLGKANIEVAPGQKASRIFEFFGKAPDQKPNRIFEFFGKPTKVTNQNSPKRRPPSSPPKPKASKRVKINSSPKIQAPKPDAKESQKKETYFPPFD